MPINIHISGDHAEEALRELGSLSAGLLGTAAPAAPATPPPPPSQPEPEKPAKATRGRGKKTESEKPAEEPKTEVAPAEEAESQPASEPVKEEPETKSVEAPADAPDIDTNDVRGCIALVNACKDMTAARALLSKFEAKKVSDIDKKHYVELVEQTAELLGVEFGPALRGARVTMLLTKLPDGDDGNALKEKFGGDGALSITDAEFAALEEAAG